MKLNICGLKYDVKYVHPITRPGDTQVIWGFVDFEKQTIQVDNKITPERQKAVLMHEIIHAIDEATGLDFSEETTDRLAVALTDVITRNKLDLNG